jgi:phage-related baseplate assembly protein
MTTRFPIDLSRVPLPASIQPLDFEATLASAQADFLLAWNALRATAPSLPVFDTLNLESEPVNIVLQTMAYREMLIIAAHNDAIKAVMLASARGTDLDAIAARYATVRLTGEPDDAFRQRILLAYEALSTAGTYGAYEYHARSADARVRDVAVFGPESGYVNPGQSLVVIASSEGQGAPSSGVVAAVNARLQGADVRPLTDEIIVSAVEIVPYAVEATLRLPNLPGADAVRTAAQARLEALVARRRIGVAMQRSALSAALHLVSDAGDMLVQGVSLISPTTDVTVTPRQMASCTSVTVRVEIVA